MTSAKYEILKRVQAGFLSDDLKNFVIPGMLQTNE